MKIKKLLAKIQGILDQDDEGEKVQKENLINILEKLEKKEINIIDKIEQCHDDKKAKALKQKLDVILAQRKKGLNLLKGL